MKLRIEKPLTVNVDKNLGVQSCKHHHAAIWIQSVCFVFSVTPVTGTIASMMPLIHLDHILAGPYFLTKFRKTSSFST